MFKTKHKNFLSDFLKNGLSVAITVSMVFPYSAFAANLELKTGVNFRVQGGSSRRPLLKSLTVLPKGSILEIPDQFVIKTNNEIDVNKSLNNWITQTSMKQTRFDRHGRPAYDYFFNVKIVKIPGDKNFNGQYGYVALKSIAEGGGIQLQTTEETDLVDSQEFSHVESQSKKPTVSSYANSHSAQITEAKTCNGECGNQSAFIEKIRKDLKTDLQRVANQTNANMRSKISNDSFTAIARNFERTCFGLKFDDFVNYVRQAAPAKNIPTEVMLGILTQESAGICQAVGDKKSSSKSVGLFQLNTRTITNVNACTRNQLQQLQGKSITQMSSDRSLRCLQNPAVNLEGGIKVVLQKYREVNGSEPLSSSWSSMSLEQKDNFRKALAAYNGGELWTGIAQKDIQYAQNKFGIKLNNDWETMRLFMFRHRLRQNGIVASNKTRANKWEISNVAYADAILGRGNGEASQKGFTDHWQVALNRVSSISVASREN
jgi:hypothetical protein